MIKYIEYYLLLAFSLHIVVAFYRAYTTKVRRVQLLGGVNAYRSSLLRSAFASTVGLQVLRGATSAPMSVFRRLYLLLSGLGVLTFVLIHLQHFKFNPLVANRDDGQEMDFFALELEIFSSDSVVVGCVRRCLCADLLVNSLTLTSYPPLTVLPNLYAKQILLRPRCHGHPSVSGVVEGRAQNAAR